MQPYWPNGVHCHEKWELIGTLKSGNGKILDVYRHRFPKQYGGISMQYGPDEQEYYSSDTVYSNAVPISFEQSILLAFGLAFDRTKERT
jgi:hypothetical protein